MHHFEVIFSRSFKTREGNRIPTTVTQLYQSKEYDLSDAAEVAMNKAHDHPLAKAGWLFTINSISRTECKAIRIKSDRCHLAWASKIADQFLSRS